MICFGMKHPFQSYQLKNNLSELNEGIKIKRQKTKDRKKSHVQKWADDAFHVSLLLLTVIFSNDERNKVSCPLKNDGKNTTKIWTKKDRFHRL